MSSADEASGGRIESAVIAESTVIGDRRGAATTPAESILVETERKITVIE